MTSSSTTFKAFTDAAAGAIAREIASLRRESQREKDVRDAEHRARLAEWDLKLAAVADLQRQLAERLASVKDGEPGRDGTDGKDGSDGEDGTSVTLSDVEPVVRLAVFDVVDSWERPKDGQDGKSVTVEDLAPVVAETVERAVAALPVAKDGRDGIDGEDGAPGLEGPPGKLPVVREWTDDVAYQGDCRSFGGSTWQALRDTAKQPPHADWQCIAKGGEDGKPARQIVIRETYAPEGEYAALDVVALNGGTFIAKKDDPGLCPGEGWQLMSSQGKRGNQGDRGLKGDKGDVGPSAPVLSISINGDGLLALHNADGSTVTCDLYPILSNLK